MNSLFRGRAALIGLFSIASMTIAASAHGAEYRAGDLVLRDPWSRATPASAKVAVGYLEIANRGGAPDRLIGGTTPLAERIEVHEMTMSEGIMRMRPIAGGLTIEPGKSVTLKPGGYHLMFIGLKAPLKQGDKLKATLTFEKAGRVDVDFDVQSIGATKPAMESPGMKGHKM